MTRFLHSLLLLALLPWLPCSCLQQDFKQVVNPDGTVKFTLVTKTTQPTISLIAAKPKDLAEFKRRLAAEAVRQSSGVDLWTSFDSSVEGDTFTLTAKGLARDVAKLDVTGTVKRSQQATASAVKEGAAAPASPLNVLGITLHPSANGLAVVDCQLREFFRGAFASGPSGQKKPIPSRAERLQIVQAQRQQAEQMALLAKGAKLTAMFNFGDAEIVDPGLFRKVNDHTLALTLDAETSMKAMLDEMAKLFGDDAFWEQAGSSDAAAKQAWDGFTAKLAGSLLGGTGAPRAVIRPKGPAFDYAAEFKAAQASQSAEAKEIVAEAAKSSGQ